MGKTQYYTATTLDGYIADENNSLDWLFQVDRETGESSHTTTGLRRRRGGRNIHPLMPMCGWLVSLTACQAQHLPVARLIISTDDDAAYPGPKRRRRHFGTT